MWMRDCIDREKLIKAMAEEFKEAVSGRGRGYLTVVDEQPSVDSVAEWVSVKDGFPEDGENVLCIGPRGGMFIAFGYRSRSGFKWASNVRHFPKVVYWIKLPAPPRKDEDNG
jgi:hypothetical protein